MHFLWSVSVYNIESDRAYFRRSKYVMWLVFFLSAHGKFSMTTTWIHLQLWWLAAINYEITERVTHAKFYFEMETKIQTKSIIYKSKPQNIDCLHSLKCILYLVNCWLKLQYLLHTILRDKRQKRTSRTLQTLNILLEPNCELGEIKI